MEGTGVKLQVLLDVKEYPVMHYKHEVQFTTAQF